MDWTRSAIAAWESTQVELHGQYSVERLQQFKQYYETTSPIRATYVIFGTALPCLALVLLADLIPLQDPFMKAPMWNSQWLFWARNLIVCWTLSFSLLVECRALVTRFKMSMRYVTVMALFLGTSTTCVVYSLSKAIGFPVPFTLVTGGSAWCVLVALCIYGKWGDLVRHNRTTRVELKIYMKVLLAQMSLTMVYPAYTYLFTQLPSSIQMFFSGPLWIIKLIAKNAMARHLSELDDLKPQEVIFNIEVFHALFVSYFMQSSNTAFTTVFVMTIDFLQACLAFYDVDRIMKRLGELEKTIVPTPMARSLARSGSELLHRGLLFLESNPRVRLCAGIRPSARNVRCRSMQVAAPPRPQDSHQVKLKSPVFIKRSMKVFAAGNTHALLPVHKGQGGSAAKHRANEVEAEHKPGSNPSLSAAQSVPPHLVAATRLRKQDATETNQTEFVQKTFKLYHLTEFLILIEFTEVVIPVVYSTLTAHYL